MVKRVYGQKYLEYPGEKVTETELQIRLFLLPVPDQYMKKSLYQLAVRYVSPIEVVGQGWGMGCKVVGTVPKLALQGSLCQLIVYDVQSVYGFNCDR